MCAASVIRSNIPRLHYSSLGPRRYQYAVVGFVLTLLPFSPSAWARWSLETSAKLSYTDNAFEFSGARRNSTDEDPSQPAGRETRNVKDTVWEPAVELTRRWTGHFPTEFSVKAHGFLYAETPILNHGTYRLQMKQWVGSQTSVLVRYRYTPNLELGTNIERRSGGDTVVHERVTSHQWRIEVERELNHDWTAALIGRYGLRLYNDAFAERDTQFATVGSRVAYRIYRRLAWAMSYLYERGLSDGRGDARFNDDVSYRQHFVSAGPELQFADRVILSLLYAYRRKIFTSELVGDTHFNRSDNTHQGMAELRYVLTRRSVVTLAYQRTQRDSTNQNREFHDNLFSLGVRYTF